MITDIIKLLESFITEEKKKLFSSVLKERTRYITVVLEDIFQPHNASAVLRTCDCFGIQDIHIIENKNKYNINPDVTMGSDKWLNIKKYNALSDNSSAAINSLKDAGYRIVATTPSGKHTSLEEFDLTKGKVALFFGTEPNGLSDFVLKEADERLFIPMHGFTESFNISVSAAIILYCLTLQLRNSSMPWKLTRNESLEVKFNWLKRSVRNSENIVKKYYSEQ